MADQHRARTMIGERGIETAEISIGALAPVETIIGPRQYPADVQSIEPEQVFVEQGRQDGLVKMPHPLVDEDACLSAADPARGMQPEQLRDKAARRIPRRRDNCATMAFDPMPCHSQFAQLMPRYLNFERAAERQHGTGALSMSLP